MNVKRVVKNISHADIQTAVKKVGVDFKRKQMLKVSLTELCIPKAL